MTGFSKAARIATLVVATTIGAEADAQRPARQAPPLAENSLVELRYGSIVRATFLKPGALHRFTLRVGEPGDVVTLRVKPAGPTLHTVLALLDPGEIVIDSDPGIEGNGQGKTVKNARRALASFAGRISPTFTSPPLASREVHTIEVFNGPSGGVGEYDIMVGAKTAKGAVINPGDPDPAATAPAKTPEGQPVAAPGRTTPGSDGRGIASPPAPDLSAAVTIDLPGDGKVRGKIASGRDTVVRGYAFDPGQGGARVVTLRRTKGASPLGFAIVSGKGEVLAQSSLFASDQVATGLAFPPGESTLAVFRIAPKDGEDAGALEFELRVEAAPGR